MKPVTITKLQTANVKRLIVAEITPDGELVTVGGKNGAGKSSLLDSIEWALGGTRNIPAKPVRSGQRRAKTNVHLSNGLLVSRVYDAASGKSRLKVTDAEGEAVSSPQTILNKLYGDLTFDPCAFERLQPTEQAAIVRRLAGVDTAELDKRRAELFAERTDTNREHKRLEARHAAMPHHDDVPAEEVSLGDLMAELQSATEEREKNAQARSAAADLERMVEQDSTGLARLDTEITELRRRLAELEGQRERRGAELDETRARAEQARKAADALTDPDLEPIKERIQSAEAVTAKVRANRERERVHHEAQIFADTAEQLTAKLEAIDDEKERLLRDAKMPIEGLGFDLDGVTLHGVPLEQASQAERLRVSVAMGLALNPTLRVLLIRDGSRLDTDGLRMVAEMAREAGAQVWLEMVVRTEADAEECSVIIEDGMVRPRGAGAEDAAE